MICPKCGRVMKNIRHYEIDRNYQFNRCECGCETHHKRIHYDEIKTKQNYMKV